MEPACVEATRAQFRGSRPTRTPAPPTDHGRVDGARARAGRQRHLIIRYDRAVFVPKAIDFKDPGGRGVSRIVAIRASLQAVPVRISGRADRATPPSWLWLIRDVWTRVREGVRRSGGFKAHGGHFAHHSQWRGLQSCED